MNQQGAAMNRNVLLSLLVISSLTFASHCRGTETNTTVLASLLRDAGIELPDTHELVRNEISPDHSRLDAVIVVWKQTDARVIKSAFMVIGGRLLFYVRGQNASSGYLTDSQAMVWSRLLSDIRDASQYSLMAKSGDAPVTVTGGLRPHSGELFSFLVHDSDSPLTKTVTVLQGHRGTLERVKNGVFSVEAYFDHVKAWLLSAHLYGVLQEFRLECDLVGDACLPDEIAFCTGIAGLEFPAHLLCSSSWMNTHGEPEGPERAPGSPPSMSGSVDRDADR